MVRNATDNLITGLMIKKPAIANALLHSRPAMTGFLIINHPTYE